LDLRTADQSPGDAQDRQACVAGVLLSAVGLATFLLMPAFVEAIATDLRYTEQQVGIVSAVVSLGNTVSSLLAPLWIRRCSWRSATLVAVSGLLVGNVGAMFLHAFMPFIVLQGLIGLCGGSLYSLSLTILSDCRRPDRYFAYAIGAQTLYEVAGLYGGPWMMHHGGVGAILALFAALAVVGLLLVRFVPAHGHAHPDAHRAVPAGQGLMSPPVILALLGCFLFYTNIGALWTYVERIGTAAGNSLDAVSDGLAFATAASMGGVFIAAWLGGRRGYLMPIAVSAVATVVSVAMLAGRPGVTLFTVANVVYGIAWNLSMSYQYSAVNIVDRSRRGVALAPAFHGAGGAAGPAIAALFVTQTNHSGVLWVAGITVMVSLAFFQVAFRLHRRARQREGAT
jgi:predicted MFS family arabinose efflux permease